MREKLAKVKMIRTTTQAIVLAVGQCFYRTPRAYEIWQEDPLRRIKRIPNDRVFWVIEK